MIFTPHIVVGAAIGAKTQNLGLIIILGIITHIIMDKLPHWDYATSPYIKAFRRTKSIKALFPLILKSTIDVTIGFLMVFLITWYKNILDFNHIPYIVLGIFSALLLDIIVALLLLFAPEKSLKNYAKFYKRFFHYKSEKEGEITFLGLTTQIIVVIIACVLLLSL